MLDVLWVINEELGSVAKARYIHTDIQTYRQTQTYIETYIQRHTYIHTYRQTDRQTYRHTDRHRHTDRQAQPGPVGQQDGMRNIWSASLPASPRDCLTAAPTIGEVLTAYPGELIEQADCIVSKEKARMCSRNRAIMGEG